MQYSFTCPIDGCNQKLLAEANNDSEAVEMLTASAKQHLADVHPDLHKTDEQVKSDISSLMMKKDPAQNIA